LRQVTRRVLIALAITVVVSLVVFLDADGYRDVNDDGVSFLDAVYYATVSLTTTGYGDITPHTDAARLFNILVITPLRIVFLVMLVGTTLEVLTERGRREYRVSKWRQSLIAHTVIVGFGVKGRAAARELAEHGLPAEKIVVIDASPEAVTEANQTGFAAVQGDATRAEVLEQAKVGRASKVIIASDDDATAVLVTLVARRLNRTAQVVVSARESENVPLLEQSGANAVITSSEAAGRMLGMAAEHPEVGQVVEDLLRTGSGLDIAERPVRPEEVGSTVGGAGTRILAVVRDGHVRRYDEATLGPLRHGDRVIAVQSAGSAPSKDAPTPTPDPPSA
jgi:voltage-gated potassium channel